MLDLEALSQVRTIIAHGPGCPDGLASAIILRDVLTEAKVVFMNYNTLEHENLPAKPHMLFVDFSPPRARAHEFVNQGTFVLDHHKHARDILDLFPPTRAVFADEDKEPGVSGAVLAYRHVWQVLAYIKGTVREGSIKDSAMRSFAKLAGIRDTWQKNHRSWRLACAQAEVLKFYPVDTWLSRPAFDPEWMDEKMQLGEILLQRKEENVLRTLKKAYTFDIRLTKFMIVPTRNTSDVAEAMNADVLIGFEYEAEDNVIKLNLSMRSRNGYDVGDLCKNLGGGGHKAAAGASVSFNDGDLNPYDVIRNIVRNYEERHG